MFLDLSRAFCPSDRSPSPRRPSGPVRLLGFGVLVLTLAGCSKQGEGERCDTLNGSEDCEQGLTCTRLSDFRAGAPGAVCCPPNPTQNICQNGGLDFLDDAGAPNESSSARVDGGNTSGQTLTEAGADLTSNASGSTSDAAVSEETSSSFAPSTEPDAATAVSSVAETTSSGELDTSASSVDAGQ